MQAFEVPIYLSQLYPLDDLIDQIADINKNYSDELTTIEIDLYDYLLDSECVIKTTELVKSVSKDDINQCAYADKLLSFSNEYNEYIVKEAKNCNKKNESISNCRDAMSWADNKKRDFQSMLKETFKYSPKQEVCIKQIYEQIKKVSDKIKEECK